MEEEIITVNATKLKWNLFQCSELISMLMNVMGFSVKVSIRMIPLDLKLRVLL